MTLDQTQEFLVQPVDASWLQCNIECQEACPVGTNCRGYLNLAAEGRFEEGYILSPRAEPGRGDVLLRLLRPLRARLPPRRHRPPARDPGDEAVPRRVARGLGHPGRHAPDHAARGAGRGRRRRSGRHRRRPRARDPRLPGHGLRQPPVRRRHDARRRPGLPPAARGHRDGRPPRRAAGRAVRVRHGHRHRHPVRRPPARLRRDRDHGRRHEPGLPRRPGRGPRRRPVRRRLHEEGEPRAGARGRPQRRRHRRRLHRDGLLAHEPALRRRERDDRLPPHPVRARRRRGGAGRDRARGRPDLEFLVSPIEVSARTAR